MGPTKYFAFIDGNQQGPFELDELIEAGIRPSTYVWCKGMDDWHPASEVEEIRNRFRSHLQEKQESTQHIETAAVEEVPASESQEETPPTTERIRFGRIPASVEPEPDYNVPPKVSMTLAVLSLLLCCLPLGIAAVFFTQKTVKTWQQAQNEADSQTKEELKKLAYNYSLQSKMWTGLSIAIGIIVWTLIFSSRPLGLFNF